MKQLGQIVGVAESTISLYENSKRDPDLVTLARIADALNTSVDALLCRAEQSPAPALSPEDRLLLQAFHQLTPAARSVLLSTAQNMLQEPSMRQDGSMSLAMLSAAG